jgi:PleD family two-component response regulator
MSIILAYETLVFFVSCLRTDSLIRCLSYFPTRLCPVYRSNVSLIRVNDKPREAKMIGKTKVLTISRDPVLMNFVQRELGDGDFEIVSTQHNGIQLRDIINTELPNFIILDIMMPSLDGIGTCLQLRQWTQAPVIMLTTWDTNNGEVRGLNLSSDSYLTEPFRGNVLKKRIKDTLKRKELTNLQPNTRTYRN